MRFRFGVYSVLAAALVTVCSVSPLPADELPDLAQLNPAQLGEILRSDAEEKVKGRALERLEGFGADAVEALPALLEYLKRPGRTYAASAFACIQEMGPEAEPAVPALLELLSDSDERNVVVDFGPILDPGYEAAVALGRIGPAALPELRKRLHDENPIVRMNVAVAFGAMGEKAWPAVAELAELLKDDELCVRRDTIHALPKVALGDSEVADALIAYLQREKKSAFRAIAVRALGKLGRPKEKTLEVLLTQARTGDPVVQKEAARALSVLEGEPAVVNALREGLKNEMGYLDHTFWKPVSAECARALGRLGPGAKAALPDLLAQIDTPEDPFYKIQDNRKHDYETARAAMFAAVRIVPDDPRTVAMLTKCLTEVRDTRRVTPALARVGKAAKPALPILKKRFAEGAELKIGERLWLATALLRIDPATKGINYEQLVMDTFDADEIVVSGFDWEEEEPYYAEPWSLIVKALRAGGCDAGRIARHIIWRSEELSGSSGTGDGANPVLVILNGDVEIHALRYFGKDGEPAVKLLFENIRAHDSVPALREITGGDHPVVRKALEDPDPYVRAGAAAVLGANENAVPLLSKALDDPSARVRLAAAKSLAEIFGRRVTDEAMEPLTKAVKDKRKSIQVVAVNALVGDEDTALKAREDVKALYRTDSWLEIKHGDREFMFCQTSPPCWGASKIDVHGWVFRSGLGRWERVLLIRTRGVGCLELDFDSKAGTLSGKGKANNGFKDKTLFTMVLDAV